MTRLAFVTNGTLDRTRRQHMADIRRECFRHKLDHLFDDAEKAVDFCRDLMRAGEDVTEELAELETAARGMLLVAGLLKRQTGE